MNRAFLEKHIEEAYNAIKDYKEVDHQDKDKNKTDIINKQYRSKMSAFGAAVYMTGLRPAIAYYRENEPVVVNLLSKMYCGDYDGKELFTGVTEEINNGKRNEVTEKLLGFSVCLKMAFNLFDLKEKE